YIAARRTQVNMLMEIVPLITDLLTPEQRRKLPGLVVNVLDPRYLASIRDGTSLYAGGPGGGLPGSGNAVQVVNGQVFFEFSR
ncbi:MAG TPA: hypothetical protein VH277_09085, partial [Gemmatimonadaceae bacterium]|nr:hypothetical protein [Gemmatimonadaceae bacterium]